MRFPWLVLCVVACGSATPSPRVAAPRLLKYAVVTVDRPSGEAELRIEPDGRRVDHFTFNDRGRGPDVRATLQLDDAGAPRSFQATGHNYLKAPVDEQLETVDGVLRWRAMGERGEARLGAGWFWPRSDTVITTGAMIQALSRAKDHRLALLPGGEVWLEDDVTREVEIAGVKQRLRRVAIGGLQLEPRLFWLDDGGELFGDVSSWLSVIRAGAESAIPALVADDQAWLAARAARLAAQLAHRPPAAGLAITHARLYDSERRTVVPDATVVVVGDRITAVGGAATPVPAGARVIDAHGRTLLPGLWDMHVHLFGVDGTLHLAAGVTTVRDLGNDFAELSARVARFDAGTELGPRVLRAGLIDGPGPFTAPTGAIASTPEQARALIQRFADAGYQQIKIYSSLSPSLVPVIAAATHARGLRLSGHIPNGMNAAEAVEQGYDEIQHANFLFLRFLAGPDDDTRTPLRFRRVAERATELDLAGPEVQRFLDLLVEHKTVLDPTLVAFHQMFVSEPGELDPALVPYASRLPAMVLRDRKAGGLPAPDGKRAQFRASFAALERMIKLAWERKIPIVAGTDHFAGLSLPHELALYVEAGIPAPEVLSLATIGAARVMRKDREAGSIEVGKRADLLLVDGDPTRDIAALRNAAVVVCRGVVYDPAELFASLGIRALTGAAPR